MFEHLFSQHHDLRKPKKFRIKFYGNLLLLAGLILLYFLNWQQGPSSLASNNEIDSIKATVLNSTINGVNKLAVQTQQAVVFDFVIKTNTEDIFLHELRVNIAGIEDQDILSDLSLYHGNTQLSQITNITDNQLYFDLDDYILEKGENYFYLSLNNINKDLVDKNATFRLSKATDVLLFYKSTLFSPDGNFPIDGRSLSVINTGQLLTYNNLSQAHFLVPSDQLNKLADFSLSSIGEALGLQKLSFTYQITEEIDDSNLIFYIKSGSETIAKATAKDGELKFNFDRPVVIKNDQDISLQLWGSLSKAGNYSFYLQQVAGKGFVSGQEVELERNLFLSQALVVDALPKFYQSNQASALSDGWNNIFNTSIIATGDQAVEIYKLSWLIENFAVDLEEIELWINDQLYPADLMLKDNILTATFWQNPILLSDTKIDLAILAKIKNLADDTRSQVNFLTDQQIMSEDNSQNNLLWAASNVMHNSYLLPGLPLAPVILSR